MGTHLSRYRNSVEILTLRDEEDLVAIMQITDQTNYNSPTDTTAGPDNNYQPI